MESTPYWAFISGFTKRQPMVVSSSFMLRENAASDFAMTKGARDMLSTPPAMTSEFSPVLMARAATEMASRLEPHNRFTVEPGTVCGRPASSSAMRATLRLSSPRLIRASENYVVDCIPIYGGVALDQGLDRNRSKIVSADRG